MSDTSFVYSLLNTASNSRDAAQRRRHDIAERRKTAASILPVVQQWLKRMTLALSAGEFLAYTENEGMAGADWVSDGPRRSLIVAVDVEGGWLSWSLVTEGGQVRDTGTVDPRQFQKGLERPLQQLCSDSYWTRLQNERDAG